MDRADDARSWGAKWGSRELPTGSVEILAIDGAPEPLDQET